MYRNADHDMLKNCNADMLSDSLADMIPDTTFGIDLLIDPIHKISDEYIC